MFGIHDDDDLDSSVVVAGERKSIDMGDGGRREVREG